MISLVYAVSPGEEVEIPALADEGFTAIERDNCGRLIAGNAYLYVIVPPGQPGTSPIEMGQRLHRQAEAEPGREILLANGGAFASPRELWQVLEAANHPRVKIAWSATTARATNRTAAMAVPTLNLRIGLVRLEEWNDESLAYARRLGGIGFSGWMVIDPPADQPARRETARDMAAAITTALALRKPPAKPAKAVANLK